jgi:hypothetical protein
VFLQRGRGPHHILTNLANGAPLQTYCARGTSASPGHAFGSSSQAPDLGVERDCALSQRDCLADAKTQVRHDSVPSQTLDVASSMLLTLSSFQQQLDHIVETCTALEVHEKRPGPKYGIRRPSSSEKSALTFSGPCMMQRRSFALVKCQSWGKI